MRDRNEKLNECSYFKKGDCRFPQEQCWNKHTLVIAPTTTPIEHKDIKCFTCKNNFRNISEMMVHRKEVHPEKVRPSNDPDRCGFTICWFLHIYKPNNADNGNQTKTDNPRINSENQ